MKQVYKLLKISHKSVFVLLFVLGLSQYGYAQAPTADAGPNATICENGTKALSGTATNYDAVQWTRSGDGTFLNANTLTPTYYPGSGDKAAGTVTLTLTASKSGFPDAIDDMVLTIVKYPIVNAGSDATICENGSYKITDASITGSYAAFVWVGGDGVFTPNAGNPLPTYTPGSLDLANGEVELTLVVAPQNPCVALQSDKMVITIVENVLADAGGDDEICYNESYTLSGTAQNHSTVLWSNNGGDGTFSGQNTLNATYYPGTTDISNGTVTLTLTASNASCPDDSDDMILSINEEPMISFGFNGVEAGHNANFEYCYDVPVGVTIFAEYGGTAPFDVTYTINGGAPVTVTDVAVGGTLVASQLYTAGTYNIAVTNITDAEGCVASPAFLALCTATVTIYEEPMISFGFNGVEAGHNANFEYCYDVPVGVTIFAEYGGTAPYSVTYTINAGVPVTVNGLDAGDVLVASQLYTPDTYNVAVTNITDAEGCQASPAFLALCTATVIIHPAPDAPTANNNTVCYDGSSHSADATPPLGSSVVYYTLAIGGSVTTAPTATAPGTYTAWAESVDDVTGCVSETRTLVTLLIHPLPVMKCPDDIEVCVNDADFDMTTLTPTPDPAPGSFSMTGAGITGNMFSPATAGVGVHTITYSHTDGNGCTNTCTFDIEVFPLPTVTAGVDATWCVGVDVQLNGTATNACAFLWNATNGTGTFDQDDIIDPIYSPSTTDWDQGYVDFQLQFAACTPCTTGGLDDVRITFQKLPVSNAGPDATICEDGSYTLSGATVNFNNGLTWSAPSGDGTWNDNTFLHATYTPGAADIAAGFVELCIVSHPVNPPCTDNSAPDCMILTIQLNPSVDIIPITETICESVTFDPYDFAGKVTYSQKSAQIWAPVTGNGTFDDFTSEYPVYTPTQQDYTQGCITISVNVAPISPCSSGAEDFFELCFQPEPTADAGPATATICENQTLSLSSATADDYSTLAWSATPDGTFSDPAILNPVYTPGPLAKAAQGATLTLTANPINPCTVADSDNLTLTIQLLPVVDAGPAGTVCESDNYTLSGATVSNDYAVLWDDGGASGNFLDSETINAVYVPSVLDAGTTVTLCVTASPISPCTLSDDDCMDLYIQELPEVDAGANALICETGYALLDATESNTSSLLWTTAGGGTFSPAGTLPNTSEVLNPTYYPSAIEVAGLSATLTLTGQPISPCTAIDFDQVTLTIQPLPIANAGADATGCETGYTLTGVSVQFNSNMEWTSNGTGSFSPNAITLNATYIPSADDIDNGLVTLTLVANPLSPCTLSDEDDMDLTIIESPTIVAGGDATICANGNYALVGASGSDYSSISWSGGDGSFTPSASVLNPTYTPGPLDILAGTVQLCITAVPNTPCIGPAFACMDLNIVPLPTANAGSDGVLCQTGGTITGVATNNNGTLWSTVTNGTFDDATALSTTYFPGTDDITAGTVTLTFTAYPNTPCIVNASDNVTYTIQKLPTVNAGPDKLRCQNSLLVLNDATGTNYSSVLWTTGGDGTFNDATLLKPTYYRGANDIAFGSVVLTVTVQAVSPCSGSATDNMTLTIQKLPVAYAGPDATLCEDNIFMNSATMANHTSLLWTTSGTGTFSNPATLNPQYFPSTADKTAGWVTLTITGTPIGPCNLSGSDDVVITIQQNAFANAGPDAAICETDTYTIPGDPAGFYSSVLWTTSGDGTFAFNNIEKPVYYPGTVDKNGATITLTLVANTISPCVTNATDFMELKIQPLPTVYAGADKTTCGVNPLLLADATAFDYSAILWSTSGDGTFSDATVETPVYIPGPIDFTNQGVVLTMAANAVSPCSPLVVVNDAVTITIQWPPIANAGADATICDNQTFTTSGVLTNAVTGFWTGGDGTFDNITLMNAIYTPGSADLAAGFVNLCLTAEPISPCAANSTPDCMKLTFQKSPVANAGVDGTVCETGTFTVSTASVTFASGQSWSTIGDGTLTGDLTLTPSYQPGPTDITNGTVELCMVALPTLPCLVNSAADCMTITIQKNPVVDAGLDASACELTQYQIVGATAYNTSSLKWSSSGNGTFSDETELNPIYYLGSNDLANTSVTLTLAGFSILPCILLDEEPMTLYIQKNPSADAGPATDAVCEDALTYSLSAATAADYLSLAWSSTGDGTFSGGGIIVNPVYTFGPTDPGKTITLTITAQPINPCVTTAVDDLVLTIALRPEVYAGIPIETCTNTPIQITTATAANIVSLSWSTSGGGTFENGTTLTPIYHPGGIDLSNLTATLTLTGFSSLPCLGIETSDVVLTINTLPILTFVDLQASLAGGAPSWYPLSGSLGSGYGMCLDGSGLTNYMLDIDDLVSTHSLETGFFNEFYHTATVPGDFFTFWSDRGVDIGDLGSPTWEGIMWDIINGDAPIFYLVYDGSDYQLIDGLQYQLAAAELPLTIPGNYPNGLYDFTGTVKDVNGCVSNSVTISMTFEHAPIANAGNDGTVCETGTFTVSTATVTNASGQLWTTLGQGTLTNETTLTPSYKPGGADFGSVELCLVAQPISPCTVNSAQDCMTITIQENPTADAGPDDISCFNGSYQLSGQATNYTATLWTIAIGSDGAFDDATKLDAVYTPGPIALGNGNVILNLVASAIGPCITPATAQIQLTFVPEPNVDFTLDGSTPLPPVPGGGTTELCYSDNISLEILSMVSGSAPVDLDWSVYVNGNPIEDPILSGSATGVTPPFVLYSATAPLTVGTFHVVLNSLTDANGCSISASHLTYYQHTFIVHEAPMISFAFNGVEAGHNDSFTYCEDVPVGVTIFAEYAGTAPFDVEYTVNANSFTANNVPVGGVISASQIYSPGVYNVVVTKITDAEGCEADAAFLSLCTATINIQGLPSVDVGDATICEGDTYQMNTTASNVAEFLWMSLGDGNFDFDDIEDPVYTPGMADIITGSAFITVLAAPISPCATVDIDDMTLTIQGKPVANAGNNGVVCEDGTFTVSTASVTNASGQEWSTVGDGTLTNETTLTPSYQPGTGDIAAGSVELCMVAEPISPCLVNSAPDCMTITIQKNPTAAAGGDDVVCEGDPYALDGTAANYSSVLWASSGDGTFTNQNTEDATYYPGSTDLSNGNVTLTLNAWAVTPCTVLAQDALLLTIYADPTLVCPTDITVDNDPTLCGATVAFPPAIVTGTPAPVVTYSVGGVPITSPHFFDVGTTTVDVEAVNMCETLNCSFTVTVNDVEDPTITCPIDVTVDSDAGECFALNPVIGSPTGDDNCGVLGYTNNLATLFPTGEVPVGGPYTITWTVTDIHGNTATCDQDITVEDNENPTITCPVDITVDADAGECFALNPALGTPTGDDNCGVSGYTNNFAILFPSGEVPVGGPYTITWTVTDIHGNTATCTQDITVTDVELPTITCPADVTVTTDPGVCTASGVVLGTPVTDDNCSVALITNDAVEPFAYGQTVVTWTVEDGSGNINTCEQIINVYTPVPTAFAGDDATICEGSTYMISDATAADAGSLLWTGGAGSFSDNTALNPTYFPDASEFGTTVLLTITVQPISPCVSAATDDMEIFIQMNPTAFAGNNATICVGDSYLIADANADNYSSVQWSTDGDGDFDDINLLNATYTPAGGDFGNIVTLSLMAMAELPCSLPAFSDMFLTVQVLPTVELGSNFTVCQNVPSVALNATLGGGAYSSLLWSENGAGSIVDNTVVPATYIPAASDYGNTVTFVLDVNADSPCTGIVSDNYQVFFQLLPTVDPGPDATITSIENYTISGASAANYSSIVWTSTGDGTFINANTLTPTYYPGTQDKIDQLVFLWIQANAINPCGGSVSDNMALTIEGTPPVVTITSPLDGTVVNYNPVTITGTTTDLEDNVSFVEVRVNGGPWMLATGTTNWTINVHLSLVCDNLIEARATDTQLLESLIDDITIEMHGQIIPLQAGWQFISSYIVPVNTSLPVIYQGLTPLNNLIMMNNKSGQIYSPTFGNTIGPWNPYEGYKVKMNTAGSLQMYGENVPNQTINVPKYSYLPVLSNYPVEITDLFTPSDVLLIFEQQTNHVYWPDGGITTQLTQLKPGYAYMTQLKNATTVTFPPLTDCPLIPFTYDNAQLQNTSPWKLNRTADVHLINIQESALESIAGYDIIGAFSSDGTCIGYVDLKYGTGNQLLTVYGNDNTTDDRDGAIESELITLIAYSSVDQTQVTLQPVYSKNMPNYDGTFVNSGVSMIVELKATTTGISDINSGLNLQMFPNPAKDRVTIVNSSEINSEVTVNIYSTDGALVKSVVMSEKSIQIDLNNINSGVYIVKMESEGKVAIERLVVQ